MKIEPTPKYIAHIIWIRCKGCGFGTSSLQFMTEHHFSTGHKFKIRWSK